MAILNVLIGAGLLFFGRKAFWLFVAGAGFVVGLALTNRLFQGPEWVGIVIGLVIGLLAALLAVLVERFAISLAGFLAGGYLALQFLVPFFHLEHGWLPWLAFVIGGIIGVILVDLFLDWALISLSSLAGAALIAEALNLQYEIAFVVFFILTVIGVAFQARELRKDRRR
jgi:drug/metabolite transporter (DMT)-like permease